MLQVCHAPPTSSASAGLHQQHLDHPLPQGAQTFSHSWVWLLCVLDFIQRITPLSCLSSLPPSMGPSFIASTSAFVLSAVTGILFQLLLNGVGTCQSNQFLNKCNIKLTEILPGTLPDQPTPEPSPARPRCSSLLHLFGPWLFEAAFIGWQHFFGT